MNPLVTTALFMLASAYGCSSPTTYPQIIDCGFIYEYANDHNLFFDDTLFVQNDVYSVTGSNEYAMFSCNNQNYIVDKDENIVLKYLDTFDGASLAETSFYIYESNEIIEYDVLNSQLIYLETNETVSFTANRDGLDNFNDLFTEDELPTGGEMLIPDWYYFANLTRYFGENESNECGVIASQILLGYYDIFQNDLLIDEIYETGGINGSNSSEIIANWPDYVTPGTDDMLLGVNNFKNYLEDNYFSDYNVQQDGLSVSETATALDGYLDDKNLGFNLDWSQFAHIPENVKDALDEGRPVILCGVGHFCIAFGYNETKFFVNDGRGDVGTIPMSAYQGVNQLIWSTGCIDIQGGYHVHSDNYYSTYHGTYYCPCGAKIKNAAINPNNWGFEAQYFFYEKQANHQINGFSFSTDRLRTGFIENEVINLSPRRQNAGSSYLKIYSSSIITKLSVNMAWWSAVENQNDGSAIIYYQDPDTATTYYSLTNILNLNLPLSHSSLQNHTFVLPEDSRGLMFFVSNQAVGDTNKGRLSLGQINIRYITYLPVS